MQEGSGSLPACAEGPSGCGLRLSRDWGGGIELGAAEGPGMGSLGAQTALSAFLSLLWPEACQAAFSISSSSFSFLANLTAFRKKLKENSCNITFTILKCTVQ